MENDMQPVNQHQYHRIREIFVQVCDRPHEERSALLEATCGDDLDLRSKVEALLSHEDTPAIDFDEAASDVGELIADFMANTDKLGGIPEQIGPYRILRLLGEGGMGVVYLAEQERPRRTVALKIVRPGFLTPQLLRRFEYEAHVLGRLQHPGIAKIHTAGVAETGFGVQPYLAMEFIDGRPLLEYATSKDLSIRDRLGLFVRICDAVQHAHQQGVIHRDLKPANILVDEAGDPKVLDFGVARAADPEIQVTTIGGSGGQMIGTLPYMSPEQREGDPTRVDTRSDVYSLGVILFELLSGRLPHDVRGLSLAEMLSVLRDRPPRSLRSVSETYRGDLSIIVGKALEYEPGRRYQSAHELASDVRAYLRSDPIDARRDSMLYVMRKRIRRYRGAVAAAVVGFVVLASFSIYAAFQSHSYQMLAQRESDARQEADEARVHAEAARRDAESATIVAIQSEEVAARERDAAQAVTAFLIDMLGLADPNVTHSFDTSVHELLAGASISVGNLFHGLPEAEAEIRGHIGRIYATLGDLDEAERHLRRAVALSEELEHHDRLAHYELLWPYLHVLKDLNDVLHSEPRRQAERLGRSILAETHPGLRDDLNSLHSLVGTRSVAHVVDLIDEMLARAEQEIQPSDDAWLLLADQLHLNGLALNVSNNWAMAPEFYRRALDMYRRILPETNSRIARTMGDLIDVLLADGQFAAAEALTVEALERLGRLLPEDHWYIALHEARLGRAFIGLGDLKRAQAMLPTAYARLVEARGSSSPYVTDIAAAMINLSDQRGDLSQREHWRDEYARGLAGAVSFPTHDQLRIALGPHRDELFESLVAMHECLFSRGADCPAQVSAALQLIPRVIDPGEPAAGLVADVLTHWSHRASQVGNNAFDLQRDMVRQAMWIADRNEYRHLRKSASTYWWMSVNHERFGEHEEGARTATQSLHLILAQQAEHYAFEAAAESLLAIHLAESGRLEEAWSLIVPAYEKLKHAGGPAAPDTVIAFGRIVYMAMLRNRIDEADAAIERQLTALRGRTSRNRQWRNTAWYITRTPGLSSSAYQEALSLVDELGEDFDQDLWTLITRGAALYRLGRYDKALAVLRSAETPGNDLVPLHSYLAMTLHQLGEHEAALHSLHQLSSIKSSRAGSWTIISQRYADEAAGTLGQANAK
jgi:eukaryotic-like serine/threonine-protein kinase